MNVQGMIKAIKPKYFPLIAVLFSIVVLLVFWQFVPGGAFNQQENADYINYYLPVARNLLQGDGLTLNGRTALNYPVGYPAIVAATLYTAQVTGLSEELVLRISVILFFALCALLIYAIARKMWGPAGALLASALWSCYPIVLWASKSQSTELPFSLAFYAGVLCLLTGWRVSRHRTLLFLAGGFLLGAAMLIRPIAIGLGIVFALLVLAGRAVDIKKRTVLALCLLAGGALAVAPWELWVYAKTRAVVPLCRDQQPFSLMDGLTFAVWNPDPSSPPRVGTPVPADVKILMEYLVREHAHKIRIDGGGMSSREIAAVMLGEFKKRPLTLAKLAFIKAARSWYGTNSNRKELLILLVQVVYLALLLWAAVLTWRRRPDLRFLVIAGAVTLCYFWGMATVALSIVRYLMPVLGLCMVFFPIIPLYLFDRRKSDG
ncbi:MAG: glycosyltransferase family 39 protein [Chitinispirillaceae bacterium]|nr:glycosyltransferase family 39 protein [Chitinispirillaceae bacterium]